MDSAQNLLFRRDKVRNRTSKVSALWLCFFRTECSSFCILKFIAKPIIKIFKLGGVGIETRHIGGGCRKPHLNGIFIHGNASIGGNCTILQQVTIGANEHKNEYKKASQIGNRVYIGAGAKIIGDIIVGDDVRIGANAVVTKNIASGKTVVGYNKVNRSETRKNRHHIILVCTLKILKQK